MTTTVTMDEDAIAEPDVYEAQAVAMFPPRPDAVMTLLHSPEFLPGTQTLLYSLKVCACACPCACVCHIADTKPGPVPYRVVVLDSFFPL